MKRAHYRNGDTIALSCGCDGCNPSSINGFLCHEHGCPEAWRDYKVECKECGCEFYPTERGQQFCDEHCAAMHYGGHCDCVFCQEIEAEHENIR